MFHRFYRSFRKDAGSIQSVFVKGNFIPNENSAIISNASTAIDSLMIANL